MIHENVPQRQKMKASLISMWVGLNKRSDLLFKEILTKIATILRKRTNIGTVAILAYLKELKN